MYGRFFGAAGSLEGVFIEGLDASGRIGFPVLAFEESGFGLVFFHISHQYFKCFGGK